MKNSEQFKMLDRNKVIHQDLIITSRKYARSLLLGRAREK